MVSLNSMAGAKEKILFEKKAFHDKNIDNGPAASKGRPSYSLHKPPRPIGMRIEKVLPLPGDRSALI